MSNEFNTMAAETEQDALLEEFTATMTIEANGEQYPIADIVERAEEVSGVSADRLAIYIKPEEKAVYYTIDGIGCPDYKISL